MVKHRSQPIVQRQSEANESEGHWLQQFENNLQKGAVQPREPSSIFDQINSIMNGNNSRSKHTSVDAAVEDMKERSGLTAYLNTIHAQVSTTQAEVTKTAQDSTVNNKVLVFQKCPQASKTLDNIITSSNGNLPVPAIIERLRNIHANEVPDEKDWDDDNLILETSKRNLMAKQSNPGNFQNFQHLGEVDTLATSDVDASNTDFFHALAPTKI
jgi:hypothetical protein